jgi:hypothetical protein
LLGDRVMKCKKRETIGVSRHLPYAEMMAQTTHADVYERPPSTHFPEAGVLYVVSRKKTNRG